MPDLDTLRELCQSFALLTLSVAFLIHLLGRSRR